MSGLLETLKPAAPVRWHLCLAAVLWTVVGTLLMFFGARWVLEADGLAALPWMALAVAGGVGKTLLVLDRTARRIVERIRLRGGGRCLGGFLSVWSYLFVGIMAGGGRLLRSGLLPKFWIGLLYLAVGVALAFGARNMWLAWYRHKHGDQAGEA